MRKIELRIKLLIIGLLFLTAFLIIVLIFLTPVSLQNNLLTLQDKEHVNLNKKVFDKKDTITKPPVERSLEGAKSSTKNMEGSSTGVHPLKTEAVPYPSANGNIASSKINSSNKTNEVTSIKEKKKVLYFIIDDAGYSMEKLKPFLDFPGDITIAVLPGLQYSKESAELALKKGKKVILHQPMESVNGNDPGPFAIELGMHKEEIVKILEHNITSIPGIIGLNNHMGSAVTTNERIVKILLQHLNTKNLLFIDSMTTHDSICKKIAADNGYAIAQRDVFLDNINDRKAIMESINTGKSIAENKGYAIMIGHVWSSELADTMIYIYPSLIEEGFILKDTGSFSRGDNYFAGIGN